MGHVTAGVLTVVSFWNLLVLLVLCVFINVHLQRQTVLKGFVPTWTGPSQNYSHLSVATDLDLWGKWLLSLLAGYRRGRISVTSASLN